MVRRLTSKPPPLPPPDPEELKLANDFAAGLLQVIGGLGQSSGAGAAPGRGSVTQSVIFVSQSGTEQTFRPARDGFIRGFWCNGTQCQVAVGVQALSTALNGAADAVHTELVWSDGLLSIGGGIFGLRHPFKAGDYVNVKIAAGKVLTLICEYEQ